MNLLIAQLSTENVLNEREIDAIKLVSNTGWLVEQLTSDNDKTFKLRWIKLLKFVINEFKTKSCSTCF